MEDPEKPKSQLPEQFEIVKVFPFTSERKAMSILIKRPDNSLVVFTKGADS